jgi:hypothetical protein
MRQRIEFRDNLVLEGVWPCLVAHGVPIGANMPEADIKGTLGPAIVQQLRVHKREAKRLGRLVPASSRLDFAALSESSSETAKTDSGMKDARKRPRSACRSIWSLWSRCRCLRNCLDPLRLGWTVVRLASFFRRPARTRINFDLHRLAVWMVVRFAGL